MKIYTAWTTAIAVTLSSIALAAAPAEARQRHGSRHHRNGADVGAIFAGIALFGVVAAIAGSASESKARERAERERRAYERERALERERAEYYPRHMESRRYDNRYDNRYERQGTAYYDRTSEHRATAPYATPPAPPAPATMAEDVPDRRAVEACSWAAEGHIGTTARIGYINSADGYRQGWRVTGTVALPGQAVQNFDCLFESGRVTGLSIK